jgi:hypothetical protein
MLGTYRTGTSTVPYGIVPYDINGKHCRYRMVPYGAVRDGNVTYGTVKYRTGIVSCGTLVPYMYEMKRLKYIILY